MDRIFNLENGNKIAIYAWTNDIWVNTLPLPLKAQPMSIANDYAGMLNSCIHEGSIYYIYRNLENNLVVGNLATGQKTEVLKDEALIFQPWVYEFLSNGKKHLMAIIGIKNPVDDSFSVETLVIYPQRRKQVIAEKLHQIDSVDVHSAQGMIYIQLVEKLENGETKGRIYQVYENEAIKGDELVVQELPVMVTVELPCKKCPVLEENLLRIKSKYNELVETTKKIQEEGKHWKQLYEETLY